MVRDPRVAKRATAFNNIVDSDPMSVKKLAKGKSDDE